MFYQLSRKDGFLTPSTCPSVNGMGIKLHSSFVPRGMQSFEPHNFFALP